MNGKFLTSFLLLVTLTSSVLCGQSHIYVEGNFAGGLSFPQGASQDLNENGCIGPNGGIGARFKLNKNGHTRPDWYYGFGFHYYFFGVNSDQKKFNRHFGLKESSVRYIFSSHNLVLENQIVRHGNSYGGIGLSVLLGLSKENSHQIEGKVNDSTLFKYSTPSRNGILLGIETCYKWMFDHGGTNFKLSIHDQIIRGRHILYLNLGLGLNIMFYLKPQRVKF
jgi:hypothetical protein